MLSTASSISLCDTVCSCLISHARHGDAFPNSGHTGSSRAPFQTQHPLEASFEKQLPIHSFHHCCLHGGFSFLGTEVKKKGLNPSMSWDNQEVMGKPTKQTPGYRRIPPFCRRRKEGWTPPCCAAAAPPPSIPTAATLAGAFEASFLPLPPTHRRLVQKQVLAGCGAVGSPARGCRQPGSPGHGASPRSWLGLGGRGSFARFGRVSRRLSAGVPVAFPSRRAAAKPVQPVRPTARRERRGGHSRGHLGTRPRNLGFKGCGQGHTWAWWQSRVQPPARPGAGPEQAGCPDIPAPLPAGKAVGCNRA